MRIVVIAGGDSAERAVSLESGAAVTAALRDRGHEVTQLDLCDSSLTEIRPETDIVVPMLHGTGGEDGALQTSLNELGLLYTGSSADSSALTFDKSLTTQRLRQTGLPVAESVVVKRAGDAAAAKLFADAGAVVVKPVCQGSSIGVSIVRQSVQLSTAIALALEYDRRCLVEAYVPGRELTVAILNGHSLPAIEIQPADTETSCDPGWYDYTSKYHDDRTQYLFEDSELGAVLGRLAVRACHVCGVAGLARVDFRVDPAGAPWILEINTIPGMTSHSLFPMAARRAGLSLGALIEATIHQAQTRAAA